MADIDVSIKRIMQIRPEDYLEFIVPGCKKEWIKELSPEKVPKKESRMDKLLLIEAPYETFILNIEPQAYFDKSMPARMLRYRADTWEYTIQQNLGTPSIKQAVIYFFKNHDNKQYSLTDTWSEAETLKYNFKPIRLWETHKEIIISKKLIGLYPLIPLMEREKNESDEDIIKNTVDIIQTVMSESLKADLFTVTSILGEYAIAHDLIKKYIGRNMLMNSPLFNEWVEEERKEAAEKAAKEAAKKAAKKYIMELLSEKFDFVSKEIRESITSIDDVAILDELHKKIIKVKTIDEFNDLLKRAKNI